MPEFSGLNHDLFSSIGLAAVFRLYATHGKGLSMFSRSLSCLLLLLSLCASGIRAAEEPVRFDCHGDPLPPHALARLGTVRFLHGGSIECLAYSPDGKLLASASFGTIVLWDAQSGRKVHTLDCQPNSVGALAFSVDSKLLVSSSGQRSESHPELRLWDVITGKVVFTLPETKEYAKVVAFSPDGKTFWSAQYGNQIHSWDTQTGKLIRVWSWGKADDPDPVFAFAPDGKVLATASTNGKIRLWDLKSQKALPPQTKLVGEFTDLSFSPDGTILAAVSMGCIQLYQTSTLSEINRLAVGWGNRSIAFLPDSKKLVNGSTRYPLALWDVASGKEIRQVSNSDGWGNAVAVSPDGKTVASSGNSGPGKIQFWDARTGTNRGMCKGQLGRVDQVRFLKDGETVVASHGVGWPWPVVIWPDGTGKKSQALELPKESRCSLICSDRSTLAVGTNESLVLLDIRSGRERLRCPMAEPRWVFDLSGDNQRAVLRDNDLKLVVWDLNTRKVQYRFEPDVSCWGRLSPDGQQLPVRPSQNARFIMRGGFVEDGQQLAQRPSQKAGPSVWDLEAKKIRWRFEGEEQPGDEFNQLDYSPDGRMFVTAGNKGIIRLWETASGQERLRFQGNQVSHKALVFSPDGRMLASCCEYGTIRLWDVRDGKELQVFAGHLDEITSIDFSPDGRRLVSGSTDTTILIWEIPATCFARKPTGIELGEEERNTLWDKLASRDAAKAYAAQQRLAVAPKVALALCQARLLSDKPTTPEQINRWIVQLDDEDFAIREQAYHKLEGGGRETDDALESVLKTDCSPEVRRRVEMLLETRKRGNIPGIRALRAVELLEQIGTAEALEVLRQLEKKTADASIRAEVQRSLRRWAGKTGTP